MTDDIVINGPLYGADAALYFLDGHYLLRYKSGGGVVSKYVTPTDVAAAFSGADQDTGWLPAGVVRVGTAAAGPWYVYSAPAQKRTILLGDETVTVLIPRTVLLGMGKSFYLWAMKSASFDPERPAFQAPFPNVHGDGRICWGKNTPGEAAAGRARKQWELFFSTPFNGDLANNKSKAHPSDVRLTLREAAGKGKYPVEDLKEAGGRIGYFIDKLIQGR